MRICVFCGSGQQAKRPHFDLAADFGREIAERGHELVYGGASVGLMGKIADSCLATQGKVYGVMPEQLYAMEVGHTGLTELTIVHSMHERKQRMYDLSHVFVAMPGGLGTLDELFEILTWSQLRFHNKPCFLLNSDGFYDHLIEHVRHAHAEGFVSKEHLNLIKIVSSLDEFFEALVDS